MSGQEPPQSTPAGWYPDGSGALRYWDGSAWTPHVQPAAVPPSLAPVPQGGPVRADGNTFSIIAICLGVVALAFCPILFGGGGIALAAVGRSKGERLSTVAFVVAGVGLVAGIVIGAIVGAHVLADLKLPR